MDEFYLSRMFLTGFVKGFFWTILGFLALLVSGIGIGMILVKLLN